MEQIKLAPYAKVSASKIVNESITNHNFTYETTIGAAIKEEDNRISFALIKTKSLANLNMRYDKYYTRECRKIWLIFKKCKDVEHIKEKPLTESETILINDASKYSAISSLLKGI